MGPQRASKQDVPEALDGSDGFGVAVVREDGKWRCTALTSAALGSVKAAETELREMRSSGAVFGLLDIDDEFFVILRPAPGAIRLLLSDATAALDYDLAYEVLERLDIEVDEEELEDSDPFEEGDLGVLADLGLTEGVLGVILADTELYADEQLVRIAREMGFADELSAVLDKLDR
ncbi:tRNA adenosine deaminase [Mycobacterium sp. MS1601]|uniref:tRNA adenosine deaminase-associated protein n=1 Tax=Mycobacterium sp. MS1601 TaxID=1936029 RepID=UPI0009794932|nr:tRNA adenosine deaminase-associated protein [Mycobacterium sp. MS1601]AQA02824.1 tRNA adenosine deaminase [Mycobacterium sp. MS1601]